MYSLIVPVYLNEKNLPDLLSAIETLASKFPGEFEAVFVVDGSPDGSYQQLARQLPSAGFCSQLLLLSRNFGSFSAIRAGMEAAKGQYLAVMAADLQEPPELIETFFHRLHSGDCDVVVGERTGRKDPFGARAFSSTFWWLYRRLIEPSIPPGGVDVFGCSATVRDQILRMQEANTSLVGQLFWVGFRRVAVPYERRPRTVGRSAWTFAKKMRYLSDSVFSFTDLPVRFLFRAGVVGALFGAVFSSVVLWRRFVIGFPVPGYAATVMTITFFGSLNCLGLGTLGGYIWRAYENSKGRPGFIVAIQQSFPSGPP